MSRELIFIKASVFIESLESYKEHAYLDSGGVWTYGIGFTKTPKGVAVQKGDRISLEDSREFLYKIVESDYYRIIYKINTPLSINQYVSLLSFVYNIGVTRFLKSTLLMIINNKRDDEKIKNEFRRWIYDNGQIVRGLKNRREREISKYFEK